MAASKLAVGISAHARSFVRDPLTLVLAVVLPAIVIEGWGQAMSGLPEMPSVQAVPLDLARILGATLGVAFIAGLLGLVLVISAREADRRLVLVGYTPGTLLLSRLVTIAAITAVVAGVNLAVLSYFVEPEAPLLALAFLALAGVLYAFIGVLAIDVWPDQFAWFLAAVFVVTLTYGMVGMMFGVIVSRLAGLWSILIATMLDIGLFQDPLFRMGEPAWWMEWLPGYHAMQVIMDAGLTADLDTAAHLGWAGLYLFVLGVVTVAVFYRETRIR